MLVKHHRQKHKRQMRIFEIRENGPKDSAEVASSGCASVAFGLDSVVASVLIVVIQLWFEKRVCF